MEDLSLEPKHEGPIEGLPLLMEHPENQSEHLEEEHVIVIPLEGNTSTSISHGDDSINSDALHHVHAPLRSTQLSVTQSSLEIPNSGNVPTSGYSNHRRGRSLRNYGLWISIEIFIYLLQILIAITVISLSRDEKPQTPLFTWVVGYTIGCIIIIPHLYWRYIQNNSQDIEHDSIYEQSSDSFNNHSESSYTAISVNQSTEREQRPNSVIRNLRNRVYLLLDHTKMALDCFFAVWFVVGNVWVFGGHSSAVDAPKLYWLCKLLLMFSCIGYAMPLIMCITICCCMPFILSMFGRGDQEFVYIRRATTEMIDTLPTYKFNSKLVRKREGDEVTSDSPTNDGGILAAGTDKERIISSEDAVCCICLSKYEDNDALRELPCSHFFHKNCVDKWLELSVLCPLCKFEVDDTQGD